VSQAESEACDVIADGRVLVISACCSLLLWHFSDLSIFRF